MLDRLFEEEPHLPYLSIDVVWQKETEADVCGYKCRWEIVLTSRLQTSLAKKCILGYNQ